eukprot:296037-Hanusia_phi.AAC.3
MEQILVLLKLQLQQVFLAYTHCPDLRGLSDLSDCAGREGGREAWGGDGAARGTGVRPTTAD